MTGQIETILTARYGQPSVRRKLPFVEYLWNDDDEQRRSTLYKIDHRSSPPSRFKEILEPLYGDAVGGFLVGDSLKIANLSNIAIFGLYTIAELWQVDAVGRAVAIDPAICFFMDSANVWYYGFKKNELWVYDAPHGELDRVSDFPVGLNALLQEWEDAKS